MAAYVLRRAAQSGGRFDVMGQDARTGVAVCTPVSPDAVRSMLQRGREAAADPGEQP